ncbi:tyrosine-type recombinase/integrase [Tissierella praeacuta]|jgi:integrase|uniref:tyrosine-type recombinase/integrase n=1 Tax=Tissierella praeacuta TaxID=43131 RepID=UPI0035E3FC78
MDLIIPIYLTDNEIKLLIKTTMKHGKKNALRDKCFIKTLVYTEMRRQESLKLNWENIDFNQNVIKIKLCKGKKKDLFLCQKAWQQICGFR